MSYGRIEINLLPPELQPGPAVRYAFLINFALIAAVVAYLVLDSVLGFARIAAMRKSISELEASNASRANIETEYNSLMTIRDSISKFGDMIGLASARYVDMPVIMDRLSRLLPDGVYIEAVSNERAAAGKVATQVSVQLKTVKRDPDLLYRTLVALKQDPILSDCYLRDAENKQVALQDFLQQYEVNWTATKPGSNMPLSLDTYEFEIMVHIDQPMSISGVPVSSDKLRYFSEFTVKPPAEVEAGTGAGDVKAGAQAVHQGTTASQGMAYVETDKEGK